MEFRNDSSKLLSWLAHMSAKILFLPFTNVFKCSAQGSQTFYSDGQLTSVPPTRGRKDFTAKAAFYVNSVFPSLVL